MTQRIQAPWINYQANLGSNPRFATFLAATWPWGIDVTSVNPRRKTRRKMVSVTGSWHISHALISLKPWPLCFIELASCFFLHFAYSYPSFMSRFSLGREWKWYTIHKEISLPLSSSFSLPSSPPLILSCSPSHLSIALIYLYGCICIYNQQLVLCLG